MSILTRTEERADLRYLLALLEGVQADPLKSKVLSPADRSPARSRKIQLRVTGTPILMYHGLSKHADEPVPSPLKPFWVLEPEFRAHLAQILASGYTALLLKEFVARKVTSETREDSVILTFDDGRKSDYELAFPALAEAGLQAVFFLTPPTVGTSGFLNWSEVLEMQRAGMSFQSHGWDHVDFRQLSARELEEQLKESKHSLEDRLGSPVEFFAAPYGLLNAAVVDTALRVGYTAVCSTRSLPARSGDHVLKRICVYRETTRRDFRRLLEGHPVPYGKRIAVWALSYSVHIARRFAGMIWAGRHC